jgi:hypothetical protein
MRTKVDNYHLVDASPDGLLVSDCIIRSVVNASALALLTSRTKLRDGHVVLLEEAMKLLNQSELRKCIVI